MRERKLVSNSPTKQELFRWFGMKSIDDSRVLVSLSESENQFYSDSLREDTIQELARAHDIDLSDGLIFPYDLRINGQYSPLPLLVTLVKANQLRNTVLADEEMKGRYQELFVNDAVWAIGDEYGKIKVAINKTDPNRNHGDVERMAERFESSVGSYLYSVGSTIVLDVSSGKLKGILGNLRIGRIKEHEKADFIKIFGEDLKEFGAFNLGFVMHDDLIETTNPFRVAYQELSENGLTPIRTFQEFFVDDRYGEGITRLKLAAHGIPFEGF